MFSKKTKNTLKKENKNILCVKMEPKGDDEAVPEPTVRLKRIS